MKYIVKKKKLLWYLTIHQALEVQRRYKTLLIQVAHNLSRRRSSYINLQFGGNTEMKRTNEFRGTIIKREQTWT